MAKPTFRVEVDAESLARIKKIPSSLQKAIRSDMKVAAEFLQEGARMRAPIITGHLRYGGIKGAKYGPGGIWGTAFTNMIRLEARATYAAIVENRRPYITPTSYEMDKVANIIAKSMFDAI